MRWLYGDEVPDGIERLDWHALNVAAASYLVSAENKAHEVAMKRAKNASKTRGRNAANTSPDAESDPAASATYTTMTLPESMFTSGD